MTLKEYLAKKSEKQIKSSMAEQKRTIIRRMGGKGVAPAEIDSQLRVSLGYAGTMNDEQREVVDTLLRLARWNGLETPPEDGDLCEAMRSVAFPAFLQLSTLLGMPTPHLGKMARKAAEKILVDNVSQEFTAEHGGYKDFAAAYIADQLFPKVVTQDRDELKTARATYLTSIFDELASLLS